MKDFQDALKEMGPSITPDMEKWYKSFMQQIRQVQKPANPSCIRRNAYAADENLENTPSLLLSTWKF